MAPYAPASLFSALEAHVCLPRHQFSELALSSVFWSFATIRHMPSAGTVSFLEERVGATLDRNSPMAIANILWSSAVLGWRIPPVLLRSLVATLAKCPDIRLHEGGLALWSLAVIDALHDFREVVVSVWGRIGADRDPEKLGRLSRLQLQLVWCVSQHPAPGVEPVPLAWQGKATGESTDELIAAVTTSSLHTSVSLVLGKLGIRHTCEAHAWPFVGDIVLRELSGVGKRVIIEVDGPYHFLSNHPETPAGSTLFKRRLLGRMGWEVVTIPYFEWNNASPHSEYLLNKLQVVGLSLEGRREAVSF